MSGARSTKTIARAEITEAVQRLVDEALLPAFKKSRTRVEQLTERVAALEAQSAEFKYCGTWQAGKDFKKGNFATHHGCVWHANCDTTEKPGQSNDWTLAVKSGRDQR